MVRLTKDKGGKILFYEQTNHNDHEAEWFFNDVFQNRLVSLGNVSGVVQNLLEFLA